MYFRNGAVVFEYLSTLLLEYVDEHMVSLNDTIDRWMPNLPKREQGHALMLANQTPGLPGLETDPGWNAAFNGDPPVVDLPERLGYAFARPSSSLPAQNWSYAHTNFMILGQILSMIGKKPLTTLLDEKVLKPMGLNHTIAIDTGGMPEPTLHAYSSKQRATEHPGVLAVLRGGDVLEHELGHPTPARARPRRSTTWPPRPSPSGPASSCRRPATTT